MSQAQPDQTIGIDPQSAPTDREKWEAECKFRDRELLRAEAETEIKRQELGLRRQEMDRSRIANPVVLAVAAAAIAAGGNAVVAYTNGTSQRELEDRKSEQARIQEMIKTGDPDTAARNLQFLVETGLIVDAETVRDLNRYLKNRKPGSGAVLPAEPGSAGIIGPDDTVPLASVPVGTSIVNLARAVGRIREYLPAGTVKSQCTAVHIGRGEVVVPGFCATGERGEPTQFKFVLKQGSREKLLPAVVRIRPITAPGDPALGFAVFDVPGLGEAPALKLATTQPRTGDRLSMILYRKDEPRVISTAVDCRVTKVEAAAVGHLCDTGAGSAGAPLEQLE